MFNGLSQVFLVSIIHYLLTMCQWSPAGCESSSVVLSPGPHTRFGLFKLLYTPAMGDEFILPPSTNLTITVKVAPRNASQVKTACLQLLLCYAESTVKVRSLWSILLSCLECGLIHIFSMEALSSASFKATCTIF